MSDIEISLIIPNYNNSKYLRNCVESAIKQTFPPKEIIIVDDKSTDQSVDIITQLVNEYSIVRCVLLETNGGVSNARNIGLRNAKCEYVTFMDADDFYYNTNKLEEEVTVIEKYARRSQDVLAYSVVKYCDNSGAPKDGVRNNLFFSLELMNSYCFYKLLSASFNLRIPRDYVIKKDILIKAGAYSFYKNLYEDYDLLLRLSKMLPFYCSNVYGTGYRQSIGGLSQKSKKELESTMNEILNSYSRDIGWLGHIKVYFWKLYKQIIRAPLKFMYCIKNKKGKD